MSFSSWDLALAMHERLMSCVQRVYIGVLLANYSMFQHINYHTKTCLSICLLMYIRLIANILITGREPDAGTYISESTLLATLAATKPTGPRAPRRSR